ncbi:presenilin-like A22 family membrane protease [Paenibacillus sp. V4I3]|uniref:hypothetical protein n=1 Tax=Paenibacillus sp. V4I3 TaxID=3042305 RepID=UPI0027880175|nr:hypothetical protein [Paenibacillus sp. V4I3]MDQ0875774.1 presenilin-like A22 family membrane protease [Paenibacillus sp. V4I3]
MFKLALPVVLSLLFSLFYSIKLNNNQKFSTIISIAKVINIVCLLIGTVWWWVTEPDGLGQVIQIIIYAICFGFILLTNITAILVAKKRGKTK